MLYELINMSDTVTFHAENDKVAYLVSIIVGDGQYGCENTENGSKLPTIMMFRSDPEYDINQYLGCDIESFRDQNVESIKSALKSFAYCPCGEHRSLFDRAVKEMPKDELQVFLKKHENERRTSMNRIVQCAWNMAEKL